MALQGLKLSCRLATVIIINRTPYIQYSRQDLVPERVFPEWEIWQATRSSPRKHCAYTVPEWNRHQQ